MYMKKLHIDYLLTKSYSISINRYDLSSSIFQNVLSYDTIFTLVTFKMAFMGAFLFRGVQTMKEYGIGMIGFDLWEAHIGYKTIPLYYENIPFRTRLMGVCTAHQRTAEKARDLNGFAFAATDPDELFSHKDIDMIHICTPNAFHKETVIKALKAGKHVYCEKPLTTSYADALEILDVLHSHSDL